MTEHVPAAAEGLPSITRRRLLIGLASASAAAAALTVEATASAPQENPKLLALIAELPAIAATFHELNDSYVAEYKVWNAKTPWAPTEMTIEGTGWPQDVPNQPGEPEMLALGGFLWRKGDKCPRRIVLRSWQVYGELLDARRAKRKAKKAGALADFMAAEAEADRLKALHDIIQSYEAAFRDTRDNAHTWHEDAYRPKDAAKDALERHIAAIMDEPDHTIEGLIIKAQALAEWDRVGTEHFDRVAFEHGQNWHGQIAASILRHAGGAL